MATIDDVAKAAGVSKSTVSNVFSQKRPISKEVSARVIEIARQLNYRPNYWARMLTSKETRIIGLNMEGEIVKFGSFHLALLNGVLKECYSQGYRLLVNTLPKEYSDHLPNVSSDPLDGEIMLDPMVKDPRITDRLKRDVPIVVIGRPPRSFEASISYVDNDNVGTSYKVTEHLLELGHRRILFLNAPSNRTVAQDREHGYRIAFEERQIPIDPKLTVNKLVSPFSSIDYGYEQLKKVYAGKASITAVITDTDKVAMGVYQAAAELKLNIPRDLSVFAFSEEPSYASVFQPALSSVKLNGELLGGEATKLLIEQCQTRTSIVKRIVVPSDIQMRESCAMAPGNTHINKAN